MAVRYSTGCINRLLGENGVDTGANGLRGIFKDGIIELFTGGQPSNADAAVTGTLLAVVTLDGLAFVDGVATNGLEFKAPANKSLAKVTADNWQFKGLDVGTIAWGRLRGNAADNRLVSTVLPRVDFSIGKGSGDLSLGNIDLIVDQLGSIDNCNFVFDI